MSTGLRLHDNPALLQLGGSPAQLLPALARRLGTTRLVCEDIPAPEDQVRALRDAGLKGQTVWQSTLIDPADRSFAPESVPDTFATLHHKSERAGGLAPVRSGPAATLAGRQRCHCS